MGRQVAIPATPLRIASLHDISITIPLIELGVFPIGSHGRQLKNGAPFIRASKGLTGYDFGNSDIEFIGSTPIDIDKLAVLQPDLIISTFWQKANVEDLQAIAPTIVLDCHHRDEIEIFDILARITQTQARLNVLKSLYDEQINRIKQILDTQDTSVNVIQPFENKLLVWHTYSTLGRVLRDAGFQFPQAVENIPQGKCVEFGAAQLPELEADYVFVTYRTDKNHTPQNSINGLNAVKNNFATHFAPAQNGRMLFLPREEATSNSFAALAICAFTVLTHISGNYIQTSNNTPA